MTPVGIEIAVADAAGAAAAAEGGADRVELCAALEVGGVTPSHGFVGHALDCAPGIDVTVLIRTRSGDFVHTPDEVDVMVRDIRDIVSASAGDPARVGFTVGTLHPDGSVDLTALSALVTAADGRRVTFHKAFDSIPNPVAALQVLADHGVAAVLTAGGSGPAVDHLDRLVDLTTAAPEGLTIVAAGGIRPDNVAEVLRTGVRDVHLRAPMIVPSSARSTSSYDPGHREVTSSALVQDVVRRARAAQ
ncbi:copper homeostasis protein CutC [Knoellia sp. CPCC 206453]|uniref:copper homeostasis protein CutC n=1 Tax=Knoellia pratensis TaxID=3404796 RepID=UPI00361EE124